MARLAMGNVFLTVADQSVSRIVAAASTNISEAAGLDAGDRSSLT